MMNKSNMFRFWMTSLVAFASLVLVSCDLDNDVQPATPLSYVSIYNASPNSPDLEINVDDRQLNSQPFEYADNTGYLPFYTGNRNLTFGPFGASSVAVDTTVTLVDDHAYSIFVIDNYEHADVLVLTDSSAAAPTAGKAMIRFINLSPDSQPVALKVKNATSNLTENIAFKSFSNFSEVDADGYNLQVVSAGNEAALELPGVDFQEGLYYTIIVRGYRTPPAGNSHVISAEVISNN